VSLPSITWGVGITLTSPDGQASVYFQPGDDQEALQPELEALERFFGPDGALRELWALYGSLAQPTDHERIAA
jgi:hypothetical protein